MTTFHDKTSDPQMSRAITRYGFKALWDRNASRQEFFECCNKVRTARDLPLYTRAKFDEGWQYRTVLHQNYRTAREEFFNLCFGWW